MSVVVEREGQYDCNVEVAPDWTVRDLKLAVNRELELDCMSDELDLLYLGAPMDDDEQTLLSLGVYGEAERLVFEHSDMFYIRAELRNRGVNDGNCEEFFNRSLRFTHDTRLLCQLLRAGGISQQAIDSAVCSAAHTGAEGTLRALLDYGADVNARDTSSNATCLSIATWAGSCKIVHLLVDSGADIHAVNGDGDTALISAVRADDFPIITYLGDNGADVNACDAKGWPPLAHAATDGQWLVARYLVEKGADTNAVDDEGCSCLMRAAGEGHTDLVRFLLSNGARVNYRNACGVTALKIAAQWAHTNVVRVLLEHGAEVNVRDNFGETPAMSAVIGGSLSCLRCLVDAGADLTVKNKNKKTCAKIAAEWGRADILRFIDRETGCCIIA